MKYATKREILYRSAPRKIKERADPKADSRWVCPHCGCGVMRKKDGTVGSHRMGGGHHMTRDPNSVPCMGAGMRPKPRPGIKVRRPRVAE